MDEFNKELDDILFDGKKPPSDTYVAIVLDRSGSMSSIANEVIGGFNGQLELFSEKNKETPIKLSVVTFSDSSSDIMWNKSPHNAKKLDEKNYIPSGMTALSDAVGSVIKRYEKISELDKEAVFLIVIMSDGMENASQKYKTSEIREMIKQKTDTGMWTFTYLGANQDMWQVSKEFGIDIGNTMAFTASNEGVNLAYTVQNVSYDTYFNNRSAGITNTSAFYGGSTIDNTTNKSNK